MRYSDTDINGHVNNTRYADFACDALQAGAPGPEPLSVRAPDRLPGRVPPRRGADSRWADRGRQHFVQGVDEAGKTRFEARR